MASSNACDLANHLPGPAWRQKPRMSLGCAVTFPIGPLVVGRVGVPAGSVQAWFTLKGPISTVNGTYDTAKKGQENDEKHDRSLPRAGAAGRHGERRPGAGARPTPRRQPSA